MQFPQEVLTLNENMTLLLTIIESFMSLSLIPAFYCGIIRHQV